MNKISHETIISNLSLYLEIAKSAKDKAVSSANKRNELISKRDINHAEIMKQAACVHRESTVSVVFSVMAIEAFINEYGIDSSSGKFFKNHLDKLDLISKILIFPRLKRGKCFETNDKEMFENLKWLVSLRNSLVHFRKKKRKNKEIDYSDHLKQKDFMLEAHAVKAVSTVTELLRLLK